MDKHTKLPWNLWQLSMDQEIYGEYSGTFILVDATLDQEITGIIYNPDDARFILECVNNYESVKSDYESIQNVPDQIGQPVEEAFRQLFGNDAAVDVPYAEMSRAVCNFIINHNLKSNESPFAWKQVSSRHN